MTPDSDRSEMAAIDADKLSSALNSPRGITEIRGRQPGRFRPIGIVVLGMHRSGTSALTRVINLAGADLPSQLLGATPDNPTGHWEPEQVYDLHNAFMDDIGTRWDDWRPINHEWLASPARFRYVERMAVFLREQSVHSPLFVLKDPRICRLAALWKEAFALADVEFRAVLPVRNPLEVAYSLLRRDGMALGRGLLIWLRHVLDAEAGSRDTPRSWSTYGQLLDDWRGCLRRIGRDLDLGWPCLNPASERRIDLFLDTAHRHHFSDSVDLARRIEVPEWVREAFAVVLNFGENGETAEGREMLDGLRDAFDAFCRIIDPVVSDEIAIVRSEVERLVDKRAAAEAALEAEKQERSELAEKLSGTEAALEAEQRARAELAGRLGDTEVALQAEKGGRSELAVRLGETEATLEAEQRARAELAGRLGETEVALQAEKGGRSELAVRLGETEATLEAEQRARAELAGRLGETEVALQAEKGGRSELAVRLGETEATLEAEQRARVGLARSLDGTEALLKAEQRERTRLARRLDDTAAVLEAEQRARAELAGRLGDTEVALQAEKGGRSELAVRLGETEATLEAEQRARAELAGRLGETEVALQAEKGGRSELAVRLGETEATLEAEQRARAELAGRLGDTEVALQAEKGGRSELAVRLGETEATLEAEQRARVGLARSLDGTEALLKAEQRERTRLAGRLDDTAAVLEAEQRARAELAGRLGDTEVALQAEKGGRSELAVRLGETEATLEAEQRARAEIAEELGYAEGRLVAEEAVHVEASVALNARLTAAAQELNEVGARLAAAETSRRQVDVERERLAGELSESAARLSDTRKRITVVEGDLETTRQNHAEAAESLQALETALRMVAASLGSANVDRIPAPRAVAFPFEVERRAARERRLGRRVSEVYAASALRRRSLPRRVFAKAKMHGLRRELLQSGLFDRTWYRDAYPEVRFAGTDPVTDFLESGCRAARTPNALFDPSWYLAAHPQIAAAAADNPFLHYLRFGAKAGLAPNFAFDPQWYSAAYPQIDTAQRNPLLDYHAVGWREGRSPHRLFDGGWYSKQHPHIRAGEIDPLAHYLIHGIWEGWAPSERAENEAELIRHSGLFDIGCYLAQAPDAAGASIDPVMHFLLRGAAQGLSPNPLFDTRYYLARNPEVRARGLNPLIHYLKTGSRDGCAPNPQFDPRWYRETYPQLADRSLDPLAHYVLVGRAQGLALRAPAVAAPAAQTLSPSPPPPALPPSTTKTYWSERIPILRQLAAGRWLPETVPRSVRHQCLELLKANPLGISVVTATWNRGAVIHKAIESVLAQTYPAKEMIVVDDGSEDDTVAAIRERFADAIASGRLVLIERPHKGICATRNAGLEHARGDLIAYLDSDNYWHRDFTLYMAAVFAAAPHLGTTYCGENIHNLDNGEHERLLRPYDRAALLARNCIDLNCFVHRRELIKSAGAFDESLTRLVDWELILRHTQYCPPAMVPIYLVEYFLDSKTLRNVTFTENWESNWYGVVRRHLRERLRHGVDPLRVGYVVWDWPALSQTFVMNELRWLLAHGIDVRVYYKTSPDLAVTLDFEIRADQVETTEQLCELLTRDRRNVLHTPFAYPAAALLTWPAARARGIPFTFMPAGVDITHHSNRKRNRVGEMSADPLCLGAIVAGSAHRRLLASYNVPMAKMVMERQAVGLPAFAPCSAPGSQRRRAISIARLIEKKGMTYLIDAATRLPEIDFVIYGYGPLEDELRAQAERVGARNVTFAGTLDTTAELHAAYHQADLLVLACVEASNGDTDGLPTVLPEAMAAGVPVVTSRLANIPDLIVDGVHGFLAEPGNVDSLTAAVRRAATFDPEQRRRLIERARERAVSFASEERMMRTLVDLWRSRPIDIVLVTYDTPAYDDWETTRAIIDRIYEHTAVPFTLIIVDNGSQPSFRTRIQERYGERPNFRFIPLGRNLFVGPATNIGIEAGSSEYVVYLCSKEAFILQNGWDRAVVTAMDAHPRAAIGGYLISLPNYRNGREYAGYPGFENWRSQDFARHNPERRFRHIQGGILAIRRSAYDAVGGFSDFVVHDGTDIEYCYYVESRGYELLDIPDFYSVTRKTWPTPTTLVDENALVMHALTLPDAGRFTRLADRDEVHCNCCGWQDAAYPAEQAGKCPQCGSLPFERTAMRQLSLAGVLQRRPHVVCVTRGTALRSALKELCSTSLLGVEDCGRVEAALTDALAAAPQTIFIIDHDVPISASLVDRLASFIALGGRVIVGGSEGPPGSASLVASLVARDVAVDEIRSASNALQLDVRLVVAIGFPASRELASASAGGGSVLGRSAEQLLH